MELVLELMVERLPMNVKAAEAAEAAEEFPVNVEKAAAGERKSRTDKRRCNNMVVMLV